MLFPGACHGRCEPCCAVNSFFLCLFLSPKAAVVPSAQTLKIADFNFSDFELSDLETALCAIRMFTDLGLVQSFQMKHEVGPQPSPSGMCVHVCASHANMCVVCVPHVCKWACVLWTHVRVCVCMPVCATLRVHVCVVCIVCAHAGVSVRETVGLGC